MNGESKMANFFSILPVPVPLLNSYVAKVVLDLYKNRETLIDAYETTLENASKKLESAAKKFEPVVDAVADGFSFVVDNAMDLIGSGALGTGSRHLLTYDPNPAKHAKLFK